MGCCILIALVMSELIRTWNVIQQRIWLKLLSAACLIVSVTLLGWHWDHLWELLLDPFAFSFVSDLLKQTENYCRSIISVGAP